MQLESLKGFLSRLDGDAFCCDILGEGFIIACDISDEITVFSPFLQDLSFPIFEKFMLLCIKCNYLLWK